MNRKDGKSLLVVESPAKAKTLQGYLGAKFKVIASKGHIKDLPKTKMGIDIENGFNPTYIIIKGKEQTVREIRREAQNAAEVLIGSDPDREGEAIAFHIMDEIKKKRINTEIKRVLFYEITKDSVKAAIKNPTDINAQLVDAQKARRILDRIVGYTVSPLLWKVVRRGLSAGRVQTVALRLLCEREEKINAFKQEIFYNARADLEKDNVRFQAIYEPPKRIHDRKVVEEIVKKIKGKQFVIEDIVSKNRVQSSPPPYKTSSLQQDASRIFGFSPKKTMQIAQMLYEGVTINGQNTGLITYMRTDSIRLSGKAVIAIRKLIVDKFGKDFLPEKAKIRKDKGSNVQGAHEAIRPTQINISPENLKNQLNPDLLKIYSLIYNRAVASQMKSARFKDTNVKLKAGDVLFTAKGNKLIFEGFYKALGTLPQDNLLPDLKKDEKLVPIKLEVVEKRTDPPARYTDATLIKTLEQKGIGRPSTYAPTISTLIERKYIERKKRTLFPTELGILVNNIIVPNFPAIFNVKFTARMEEELDKIEQGTIKWKEVISDFYTPFEKTVKSFEKKIPDIKKHSVVEETNEKCPVCGAPLVVKWGRFGKFLACSKYPECKYTRPLKIQIVEGEKCPVCGKPMMIREGRSGRFLACIDYPKCPGTKPLSTGVKCPDCDGEIVERKSKKGRVFYACSNYPKCKFTLSNKPVDVKCPSCGFPLLEEVHSRRGVYYRCPSCKKTFKKEEIEKLMKGKKGK